ncbi:MAG: glycosyltransferase [Candidatus Pacebacteria bacterium]|nr:glycosyltransferase [Candidatus Paceibacterota bacterium]MBP9866709.1 glycosyltransferase [Candidatus Paceibacterota bacterium]
MKIAINVSREFLGGITASNLSFIKHIYGQDIQTVAIEINARRVMKGPVIFRQLNPALFDHNIINIHNYNLKEALDSSNILKDLESYFSDVINDVYLILKETKPDVFLISGTYYIPWILSVAAKKAGIPIVLWYSGILTKEVEHYKEKDRKLFYLMELSIIKRAKKIIFPSKICKTTVEELFHKHLTAKTYVIPNAVNKDFLSDVSVDFSVSRRIAGVGRYTYIKNFDTFFEIHKKLLQQKWDHECFFCIEYREKNTKNSHCITSNGHIRN